MTEFFIIILIVFVVKIKTQINGKNDQNKYNIVGQKSKKEKLTVLWYLNTPKLGQTRKLITVYYFVKFVPK